VKATPQTVLNLELQMPTAFRRTPCESQKDDVDLKKIFAVLTRPATFDYDTKESDRLADTVG
jgi:hypothetical protein